MPEDIRLAKGEDVDALTETVNNHISDLSIHVTQVDKENWNGKADLSMLQNEGYLKKKIVGALPSLSVDFDFSDGVSKFSAVNRCVTAVEANDGEYYQKITTGSNASNTYAFAYLDFEKYTKGAKRVFIEFDTKIDGARWYIGLSDLSQRPGESYRATYTNTGVVFSQGTKDGTYYYVNGDITWVKTFFGAWVHSKVTVDFDLKQVSYEITSADSSDIISGTADFEDAATEQVTGLEIYSYVNNAEVEVDNISITAKSSEESDERTVYIIAENNAFAEYIYIDGKPVCIGRSDIIQTVNDLLERVTALENS